MEHDELFNTLFPAPGAEPATPEQEDAALQSLLEEVLPQEDSRGLDLSGLLGSLAEPQKTITQPAKTTKGLDLKSLLTMPGVEDNLKKILIDKFKLPEGLALILAQGILKGLNKKKTRRTTRKTTTKKKTTTKRKTSTTKRKTTRKTPPKTTPRKKTSSKRRSSSRADEVELEGTT